MISISCVGRLVTDPELSQNIQGCCNLRIAADSVYDKNTRENKSEFFNVSVFGRQGESCATYLHKGDMVFVSGQYVSNEFVGRDNQTHISQNIRNADVQFMPKTFNHNNAATSDADDILPED